MKISQLADLDLAALITMLFQVLPDADKAGLGAAFISAATNTAHEIRARCAGTHADGTLFGDCDVLHASQLRQLVALIEGCAVALERIGFPSAAAALRDNARCDVTVVRPAADDRLAGGHELRSLH